MQSAWERFCNSRWCDVAFVLVIIGVIVLLCSGCAGFMHSHVSQGMQAIPPAAHAASPSLQRFLHGLDWFMWLSVAAIAASAALFFYLPTNHRLSMSLGVAGSSVIAMSMFLKVTAWLVPWFAGGAIVLAVLILAYELWRKARTGSFDSFMPSCGEVLPDAIQTTN
jgi:hypothetical protein